MRKKRKLRARAEREGASAGDPAAEGEADGGEPEATDDEESAEGEALAEVEGEESAEVEGEESAEVEGEESAEVEGEESAEVEGEESAEAESPADSDEPADVEASGDEAAPADDTEIDPDAELTPAFTIEPARLKSILESLLFAAEKPLSPLDLKRLTGFNDTAAIQAALESLTQDYADRGVSLYDVAGGFQFRTHPDNSEYVQRLVVGRPVRLSRAQLETLAIVAYRQPVTRPEIDDIRGVDSGSTIKVLLDRTLIRVLGKKEEPGRPLLYGTSKEFLEFFNLRELRDLPTLREFHELTEESLREVEALDQAGQETDGEDASGEAGGGNGAAANADPGKADQAGLDDVHGDDDDDDDDGSSPSASH